MSKPWKFPALAALTLAATLQVAHAQDKGVPVTITVLDVEGNPIPTAVIRHPQEEARHRVNTANGTWGTSVLSMPDGTSLVFEKGVELKFEVSAPGYTLQTVDYIVRKRKNNLVVTLESMPAMDDTDDMMDDIQIGFGRSVPLDGTQDAPDASE